MVGERFVKLRDLMQEHWDHCSKVKIRDGTDSQD